MRQLIVICRLAVLFALSPLACLSLAVAGPATTIDFNIESTSLRSVPDAVSAAIRRDANRPNPECALVGMPIHLSSDRKVEGYVVTTAEACDWGGATGPIWLIQSGATPTVVLSGNGYSLQLSKASSHGLLDAHLRAATSGWSYDELWVYDGRRYVLKSHKSLGP